MDMAKVKLVQLSQHGDLLDRYGARVRVLGRRDLLKPDVNEAMDKAIEMTAKNDKRVLNVCFPYTSREEITTAIRSTVEDYSKPLPRSLSEKERPNPFKEERIAHTIRSQHLSDMTKIQSTPPTYLDAPALQSPTSSTTSLSSISQDQSEHDHETSSISTSTTLPPSDFSPPPEPYKHAQTIASQSPVYRSPELITPQTLDEHMYTANDPPVALLVRTSGVYRLSDFMLWQCHQDTQIVFLDVLWPQFDLWTFLPVLWEWQWRVRKQQLNEQEEDLNEGRNAKKGVRLQRSRSGQVPL